MHNTPRSRIFSAKTILVVALGLTTPLTYSAMADVTTDPVGFITLAATTGPNRVSRWGMGMTMLPEQKGSANVISNAVTDASAAFSANQWAPGVANPYELELTSGPLAGYYDTITGNDAQNVYLANSATNSPGLSGVSYLIRPIWTLNKAFGSTTATEPFQGGTSSGNADNVQVWDPSTQGYTIYYFKTSSSLGGSGWRSSGNSTTDKGSTPLYIDRGMTILRSPASNLNVLLVGAVKLGPTISPIIGGSKVTRAANVYPFAFTLANSGLFTGSTATGLQGGTSANNSDQVQIWDPSAQNYTVYFFKTSSSLGGSGWRSSGNSTTDKSGVTYPLGGSATILRVNANGFNWVMPQPFSN
jgi:uncharacterized protein (TIGR02597 family)